MLIKNDNLIPDKLPKLTSNIDFYLNTKTSFEALAEIFGKAEDLQSKPYKFEFYQLLESNVAFEDEDGTPTKWKGLDPECDFCQRVLSDEGAFVDGRIHRSRQWAIMCLSCYMEQGAGFGEGNGQLYLLDFSSDWILVAGSGRNFGSSDP